MGQKHERAAFDLRHSTTPVTITVLVGDRTGGGGKVGGAVLWTASADVLAYVDEHGTAVMSEGRLSWLATDEQRGTWIHGLEPLTQYVMHVRRETSDPSTSSHRFALDDVVEAGVHLTALDERLERWLAPVTLTTDAGEFELERSMGFFSGWLTWCGNEVSALLDVDEGSMDGSETCTNSMARLAECCADAENTDARWRAFAAATLTERAEEWRDQSEEAGRSPITAQTFAERIRLTQLCIAADGSMAVYFDDDDMFLGHAVAVEISPDRTERDAHLG